ncbi:MAG: OmpH family outer membrane protein [Pseudomonadota bacterium]
MEPRFPLLTGTSVVALAVILLATVLSHPVLAQDQPDTEQTESPITADPAEALVIMVVDFQGVVRRSAAAVSIQQQVSFIQRNFQAKYQDLEERLRDMESELAQLRGTLSEDEFVDRRREFEREVTVRQREAQTQRTRLDEALNQSMALVRATALEIIAEFADDAGAGLVLNRADIIMSDRDLDRTVEILAELDRRLPTVEVDLQIPAANDIERADD